MKEVVKSLLQKRRKNDREIKTFRKQLKDRSIILRRAINAHKFLIERGRPSLRLIAVAA